MPTPLTVAFTLSEDEVNALDATPVTIIDVGVDTKSIIRVPTRLEIWREAGTAYAATKKPKWDDGNMDDYDLEHATAKTLFPAPELWICDADARGERGQLLFRVPIDLLETTLAHGMVVLPEPGLSFVGKKLTLTIESGCAISGGTGAVKGILYFDEIYLPV